MKLSIKQLKRIIQETASYQNEGFFSDLGEKANYGITKKEMLIKSSEDALAIFDACAGLGTDEEAIIAVLEKREKDIPKLYAEFQNLIMNWVKGNATGVMSQEASIQIQEFNQDLIAWLDQDGMSEEAELVEKALKEAGMQRKEKPAKVKGFFGQDK